MDPVAFAALGEPNRLRIVELLSRAPRSVGEIARLLGLRQPQATKHLQTLQRAGLVTLHPLGTRRIYALRREPFRDLLGWLAPLGDAHPSEDVLEQYRRAIEAESGGERTLSFDRQLPAPPAAVWRAWTSADVVRRWWSPRHFTVAECEVDPSPGGLLRIVMEEGDGTRHVATGRFRTLDPPTSLGFELAPVDDAGRSLFSAVHEVRMSGDGKGTRLSMTIAVDDVLPGAAPAVAGLEPGWEQLLDNLAGLPRSP